MSKNKLDINKNTGNFHMKIRLMPYDDLMKVSDYLRSIDGYSYITIGALVVEGTATQLNSMIDYMCNSFAFTSFGFVDMSELYLGDPEAVQKMLKQKIREDKIDKLL